MTFAAKADEVPLVWTTVENLLSAHDFHLHYYLVSNLSFQIIIKIIHWNFGPISKMDGTFYILCCPLCLQANLCYEVVYTWGLKGTKFSTIWSFMYNVY